MAFRRPAQAFEDYLAGFSKFLFSTADVFDICADLFHTFADGFQNIQ
jgi:hypothetical protein